MTSSDFSHVKTQTWWNHSHLGNRLSPSQGFSLQTVVWQASWGKGCQKLGEAEDDDNIVVSWCLYGAPGSASVFICSWDSFFPDFNYWISSLRKTLQKQTLVICYSFRLQVWSELRQTGGHSLRHLCSPSGNNTLCPSQAAVKAKPGGEMELLIKSL